MMSEPKKLLGGPMGAALDRLEHSAGGPARSKVVLLLALVLAVSSADVSTIGAIAGKLETSLMLTNAQLGVVASVPAFCTAVATVPVGLLTDRMPRVPLVVIGVLAWSVGEAVSGASQSFVMLLLIRIAVGIGIAPTGPTLASILGDYFPARDRAHIYGLILTGELIGAGFGFLIAGEVASAASWRWAFVVLAIPSGIVAYVIWRWLPEPARGGASRLEHGAQEIVAADDAVAPQPQPGEGEGFEQTAAQREVSEQRVPAHEELVLHRDPADMPLWHATRYVLRIRTNLVLICASGLGYFYFAGVETFGIVFVRSRYGLPQSTAVLVIVALGIASIVGVLAGGWMADWLLGRGRVASRVTIGAISFIAASLLFFPGLMVLPLAYAMPFYLAASIAFGARNPSLDAARLDIMHHRLWGRAEGVRSLLRQLVVAAAPVTFGVLADALGSGSSRITGAHGFGANASSKGLHIAFLVMLVTLFAGGMLTLWARKTYPGDVSTAIASEEATKENG